MAWDNALRALRGICADYLYEWDRATEKGEPPPDALHFCELVERQGVSPPGLGETISFIERCRIIEHERPEVPALLTNLMQRRFYR